MPTHSSDPSLRLRDPVDAAEVDLHTMGVLANGLSHTLGTPLTSVMNNLVLIRRQLAREVAGRPEHEPLLEALSRETDDALAGAERLELVLRAIRDSFKVLPRELRPVSLADSVTGALDMFERLDGGLHRVERDFAPAPLVPLDAQKVHRVALMLLNNAAAFTPPDGRIVVRVRPVDEGVELAVEDEGSGILPEVALVMYEPFFTTRPGSVGLGLTLARAFVAVQQGALRHESEPGRGARFVAWFPSERGGGGPRTGGD